MFKAFDERRAQKSEASYGAFADQSQDVTSEFVVEMRCVKTGKEHAWKTRVH
jgi:hypothetical protein